VWSTLEECGKSVDVGWYVTILWDVSYWDSITSLFINFVQICHRPTSKTSETSAFCLPNKILAYLGILLHLLLFTYGLVSCVLLSGNLLPRLLVILYSGNCLYNIFLIIFYTTTILTIVLITNLVYKTE